MPTRARKPRRYTATDVERGLDKVAWLMSKSRNAHLLVPVWQRLERERDRLIGEEAVIDAARLRAATRSMHRTEAQSA